MKSLIYFILIIFSSSLFAQENPNQKYPFALEYDWQKKIAAKPNKTIKDYFMLIPSCFIDCEMAGFGEYSTAEKRDKIISKLDSKNGYLTWHKRAQLVLFKDHKKNIDIIAIQTNGCGASTNTIALNTLLEFKDNRWTFRVDLLPDGKMIEELYYSDDSCPYFDLPLYGTTILIRNEYKNNSIITEYKWNGQRFTNKHYKNASGK